MAQYGMGETIDSEDEVLSEMEDNEETSETDSEMEDNEETTESKKEEQDYWETMIAETCREMELHKEIKNPKELMKEPMLGEFLEELRQNIENKMKFADYMQNEDKVYKEIHSTAERYEEKDLDEDEAFEKAWNKRKYLLIRLLRDNLYIVQDVLNENYEDSDED
jgi:hypothetical protein